MAAQSDSALACSGPGSLARHQKDATIYFQGDQASGWFVVVDGIVRTCRLQAQGRRQLTGFYYEGDIFGVGAAYYAASAEAVVATTTRRHRFACDADGRGGPPAPSRANLERALSNAEDYIGLLRHRGAGARLAAFLVAAAGRGNGVGMTRLRMSRSDIADYLGLTIETVSRAISDLARRKLIELSGPNNYKILDDDALQTLTSECTVERRTDFEDAEAIACKSVKPPHPVRSGSFILGIAAMMLVAAPDRVQAATVIDGAAVPGAIEAALLALRKELAEQRALIAAQSEEIASQQRRIDGLVSERVMESRARGFAQGPLQESGAAGPSAPVGEAPVATERTVVAAVPEGQGVLTSAGGFVFDPSIEYTRSSTNRLVFRGIELIPGVQLGLIEATDADRDTFVATAAFRYGITDRLEVEARIPFLHRYDRIEVVQQREEGIVRSLSFKEDNIGDVEFAVRYQLNRPVGQKPIFIAGLRVKSDTGKGPFSIPFDSFGIATGLATGSGFWAVSPGISFLLPSDPVVIYGGTSYLYHIAKNVDREVDEDVFIGRVDPGDAVNANIGFGFALNPRFSFSLGYRHSYIFKTVQEIGDTIQKSRDLQVGSLNLGMSYRITDRRTVNLGFEFGVTEDAPDVSLTMRVPFSFRAFSSRPQR